MPRSRVCLARQEHLFVELLARTHPGELDVDVMPHLQSRQLDQVARQVYYLQRLTHVEHEHFAPTAQRHGLQHQLHRFRYGHEVAYHIGVSDGDGPTCGYLLAEGEHHTATA